MRTLYLPNIEEIDNEPVEFLVLMTGDTTFGVVGIQVPTEFLGENVCLE